MTRDELIRKYCQLREATAETIEETIDDVSARDCFCEGATHKIDNFQDDVFEFIRSSVALRFKSEGCDNIFNQRFNDIVAYDARRNREIGK